MTAGVVVVEVVIRGLEGSDQQCKTQRYGVDSRHHRRFYQAERF